jgi:hypothetical protein
MQWDVKMDAAPLAASTVARTVAVAVMSHVGDKTREAASCTQQDGRCR